MSDIQPSSIGYLSPLTDFALKNSQALGGVSHLWQDFFARALAEQRGENPHQADAAGSAKRDPLSEPQDANDLLSEIVVQRSVDIQDTPIRPPQPMFLPIAEFELDLLDKPAPPFAPQELATQQQQQDFDSHWVRPLVLNAGQPVPQPGPAPQPRPLHLPIAEFELDLLDKPAAPFDEQTLAEQQKAFDFDTRWARPLVVQNLRIAA